MILVKLMILVYGFVIVGSVLVPIIVHIARFFGYKTKEERRTEQYFRDSYDFFKKYTK